MNLIFQLLYLSSFVTPILAPVLYRNKRPSMIAFYRNMATSHSFRKLFIRMLTLYLITFHFYHLSVYSHPLWLLPSTIITGMLFFSGLCDKLLHMLQQKRTLITVFCIGFLTLPIPELLPLGFTLLVISIAAVFYPCRQLTDSMSYLDNRKAFLDSSDEDVVNRYFTWPDWNNDKRANDIRKVIPDQLHRDKCAEAIEDADVIEFIESDPSK